MLGIALRQTGCLLLRLNKNSTRYERLVLLLLTVAYAFNAMDRGIVSIIGQAISPAST